MNSVRFHKLLANSRQSKKLYSFSIMLLILMLSACAEKIATDADVEQATAFNADNSISSNAITTDEANGNIVNPAAGADTVVYLGDKVYFSASGFDPTGNYPLSFHWNFGSIQPNSLTQNPGYIKMDTLGTHRVVLTVTNSIGISDSTPEVRIITVKDPTLPVIPAIPGNLSPIASINSPIGNLSINVGDTVNFTGSGFSPVGKDPMTYLWNFSGAAPNTINQNPGNITFFQAGIYPINLSVIDTDKKKSTNVAEVIITVGSQGVTNNAPIATILSPPGDLMISTGDSIYFTGTASDIDGNNALSYNWDFAGAANNSTLSTPGNIMFTAAGTYPIRLIVTDSLGLSNLTPAIRLITVTDVNVENIMPLQTVITSPATDITIDMGDVINFEGEGNNGDITGPLRYLWDFEHMSMPASMLQNPGIIAFPTAGEFEVELLIADANGNVVSHKVERKITVLDPNALRVHIHEPATHQTIDIGASISFQPMVINDPLGSPAYTYHWRFDGAALDSILEFPDPVMFTSVGSYKIDLTIRDPLTNRMAIAKTRMINVVDPDALQATITSPMNNQMINIGDTLNFEGLGVDPLGTAILEYMWKFDGVTLDTPVQSPGEVTFSTVGHYKIQLVVNDPVTLRRTKSNIISVEVVDPLGLMAEITSPSSDLLLYLGESVDYRGMGIDPANSTTAFMYYWQFKRGITFTVQNPGLFTYDMPGEYEVKFQVSDPLTGRRSHKIEREIHVMPVASPSSILPMVSGTITAPMADMTIASGDVVVFEATGFDPAGGVLLFHWNFDGAALNTTAQNPGAVMFGMPGIYTISVLVSNTNGEFDPDPPSVVITVM